MSNTCTWCGGHVTRPLRDSFWSTKNFCGQRCLTEWKQQSGHSNQAQTNNEVTNVQREILELERNRLQAEENRRNAEASKKRNQQMAATTIKIYKVVKPYLLYIVIAYIIAFVATYFMVKHRNQFAVIMFFSFPLFTVLLLVFNTITNKPDNE